MDAVGDHLHVLSDPDHGLNPRTGIGGTGRFARPAAANLCLVARPSIIGWLEWLRVGAIVGVVVLHVLSPVAFAWAGLAPHTWAWINIADSASRWCVPVFIMVSGALHLGRRDAPAWDGATLGRRLARVGIPLLFWSLFFWWFGNAFRGRTTTPDEFAVLFLKGTPYFHLYFLFIIIGLYAITPVLRPFVDRISDKALGWFAIAAFTWAWLARLFLEIDGGASSTSIDMFTRYIGYYLAGAWLLRVRLGPGAHFAPLVAIAAIAATAVGTALLVQSSGTAHQTLLYSYLSPLTVVSALAVFVTARVYLSEAPRWVIALSGLTFGIYLIHPAILWFVAKWMPLAHGSLKMPIAFVVQVVTIIAISAVLAAVIARIPWLSTVIGGAPPRLRERPDTP